MTLICGMIYILTGTKEKILRRSYVNRNREQGKREAGTEAE